MRYFRNVIRLFKSNHLPIQFQKRYLSLSCESLVAICFFLLFTNGINAQWLQGYEFRKKITLNSALVTGAGSHANFPILVSVTDNDLRHASNGGNVTSVSGYDIAFASSDGSTTLYYDLEDYVSTTGTIVVWVNIPSLSTSADTDIYMYYGNSSISADGSSESTWNPDFEGVWHFHDDFEDRTSNTNNATNNGSTNAVGKIGDCQSFASASLQSVTIPDDASLDFGDEDFAIELWFRTIGSGNFAQHLVSKGSTISTSDVMYTVFTVENGIGVNGELRLKINDGTNNVIATSPSTYLDTTWHHLVFTRNTTSGEIIGYVDGGAETWSIPETSTGSLVNNDDLVVGCRSDLGFDRYLNGEIDELRVIRSNLSADWIKTSYDVQNNPASFVTFDVEESAPQFTSLPVITVYEDTVYTYNIIAYDDDGDAITLNDTTNISWLTLTDNGDGTATFTGVPTNNEVGTHNTVISVCDAISCNYQSYVITVANTNDNPVLTISSSSIAEGNTIVDTAVVTDVDLGDTKSFVLSGTDAADFTIDADGELSFLLSADYESPLDANLDNVYELTITVNDGNGGADFENITITVTDVIEAASFTIDAIPDAKVTENSAYTSVTPSITGVYIGNVTYTITGGADAASFTINASTGVVSMIARDYESPQDANMDNVYEIEISATDDDGNLATESWTVSVLRGSVLPVVIATDDSVSMLEDEQKTFNLLSNDQYANVDSLIVELINPSGISGNITLSNNGDLNFTPVQDYYGVISFQYYMGLSGSSIYLDTSTVIITIEPVNDKPIVLDKSILVSKSEPFVACLQATDIDSDECFLHKIIGGNYERLSSTWSNNLLCFELESNAVSPEDRLECVVCDNGTPMECDTALLIIQHQIELQFAEGISPNGDGRNDTWLIHGIESYQDNNIKIFNRWGSLIYEADNYNNSTIVWDGSMNRGLNLNKFVPKGTYFFVIQISGFKKGITGSIEVN
ncbi:MAG: DUF2341 domain-containing protein [Bacteroidales bacterium]|nr:DUF2341 domain-containing protein [Bacteroidales bacterium]